MKANAADFIQWFEDLSNNIAISTREGIADILLMFANKANGESSSNDNDALSIKIFSSTWNMGEGEPPDSKVMKRWLPEGYQVYVIGVQECMHWELLQEYLQQALGPVFQRFSHQIGNTRTELGFHGYIGLVLFVHEALVRSKIVPSAILAEQLRDHKHHQIALGKNLGVVRASNKGGVSLTVPLRLERLGMDVNTNVTFISCHLASDKNGVSKAEKRNADAMEIIKELALG